MIRFSFYCCCVVFFPLQQAEKHQLCWSCAVRYLKAESGWYWLQAYLASVLVKLEGLQPQPVPCDCFMCPLTG